MFHVSFLQGNDTKLQKHHIKQGDTFMMGADEQAPEALDNERPVHPVTLSDYYIGRFEVTHGCR